MAHGFSAACGKLGALFAGVAFSSLSDSALFYTSGVCGLVGLCVTALFLPDVTGLDLSELDHRWDALCDGDPDSYQGPASESKYLSMYERMVLGRSTPMHMQQGLLDQGDDADTTTDAAS